MGELYADVVDHRWLALPLVLGGVIDVLASYAQIGQSTLSHTSLLILAVLADTNCGLQTVLATSLVTRLASALQATTISPTYAFAASRLLEVLAQHRLGRDRLAASAAPAALAHLAFTVLSNRGASLFTHVASSQHMASSQHVASTTALSNRGHMHSMHMHSMHHGLAVPALGALRLLATAQPPLNVPLPSLLAPLATVTEVGEASAYEALMWLLAQAGIESHAVKREGAAVKSEAAPRMQPTLEKQPSAAALSLQTQMQTQSL